MLTAVLFTIAKIWMPPKCPSRDKWVKKICVCVCVCVCNGILPIYHHSKKNKLPRNKPTQGDKRWIF